MGALVIPVVIVVVALVGALVAVMRFTQWRRARADSLRSDPTTLHYNVPAGVDPAEVVVELSRLGYEAVSDASAGQSGELLIGMPGGRAPHRERTRRILEEITSAAGWSAHPALGTHVHFTDEETS